MKLPRMAAGMFDGGLDGLKALRSRVGRNRATGSNNQPASPDFLNRVRDLLADLASRDVTRRSFVDPAKDRLA